MKKKFDRHTFDPIHNGDDLKTLNVLRGYGGSRFVASSALFYARVWHGDNPARRTSIDGKRFLDIGCGDSRDWLLAREEGCAVTRFDLFPPRIDFDHTGRVWDAFIQGDAAERLPFDDNAFDIVICQAMIDLVEPDDRLRVYQEVERVLDPNGIFVLYIQPLSVGWGITRKEETTRLRTLFPTVDGMDNHIRCNHFVMNKHVVDESKVGNRNHFYSAKA